MTVDYPRHLARLHSDTNPARWAAATRHRAPHKPLALLAILDLFAEGTITSNLIELTPDLGELFTLYWARVMPPDARGNLAMPFFHLRSEGFWHLVPRPGMEPVLASGQQLRSVSQLRGTVVGARLDDELYLLMTREESRNVLRAVLIESYFAPDVQPVLVDQGTINVEAFRYGDMLLARSLARQVGETLAQEELYRPAVRDQGFRRAVVTTYTHRCALCGLRVLTPDGHTAVDAGHIIPWSVSHDDDPCNGMALCRLCHWAFDEGLCSVSPRYTITVSSQLAATGNLPGHLLSLAGRDIAGPAEPPLWPRLEALHWHHVNIFRAR